MNAALVILTELLDSLPWDHPERKGIARALQLLRHDLPDETDNEARRKLASHLLDPEWKPAIFLAGDEKAIAGEGPWFVGGAVPPQEMGDMLRRLARQIETSTTIRAQYHHCIREQRNR